MSTDTIRKEIVLKAPLERVWRAISDSSAFGAWFGVKFQGPFVAGSHLDGHIVPTQVDPQVAKLQEPHTGKAFKILVETLDPMQRFAFRWHPYDIDPNRDCSSEPTTLVTFSLSEVPGGTLLVITESGFDQIPVERRAQAFQANDGGWTHQTRLIEKYLTMHI